MAVTIHTTPATYALSDNPLMYRFSSNQTGQANFSYKVEVYLDGVVVSPEQVFPESGIYAHIDISETVAPLIQDPQILNSMDIESPSYGMIKIKVTEMYGSPPTAQATATSTETTCIKGALPLDEWEGLDLNSDWKGIKWLTKNPTNSIEVLRDQTFVYSMLVDSSKSLSIKFYDSGNVLLHTYGATSNYTIWQLTMNNTRLLTDAGISVFNLSQTAYYTVQIGTSDILTVTFIDDLCYTPKALIWANEFGSFDTFIFAHNDMRRSQVDKRTFQRQYGGWNDDEFVYDHSQSGSQDFAKVVSTGGTLVSGYIEENVHNWLVSLIYSPWLMITWSGETLLPINVTDNNYKDWQERFEELPMLEVNYNLSNKYNALRR